MPHNYYAFKMRTYYDKMESYKGTVSSTVKNNVEDWFKERISTRMTAERVVPVAPKNTIEMPVKLSKPPGLQKYTFNDNEINDMLRVPQYEEFCYVDLVTKNDNISEFLMRSQEYSTPLFIE